MNKSVTLILDKGSIPKQYPIYIPVMVFGLIVGVSHSNTMLHATLHS
jgi:hypothetical protein